MFGVPGHTFNAMYAPRMEPGPPDHARRSDIMLGGASLQETGFAAVLVFLVLLAPLAPKIGEALGSLFEKREREGSDEPL